MLPERRLVVTWSTAAWFSILRSMRSAAGPAAGAGVVAACLAGVVLLAGCAPAGTELELATLQLAQAASAELVGYSTREFGGALATRCVEDVFGAFQALPGAPSGKLRYRSMGGSRLPPVNARLRDFADWDPHVQSIARLSLPWPDNLWAAVSRSNPGSVGGAGFFLIYLDGAAGADGTRWVYPGMSLAGEPPSTRRTYFYHPIADTAHPGGMQASGDYLVVAAEAPEGAAPFVELFQRTPDDVTYQSLQRVVLYGDLGEPVAPSRFITAAALARLDSGAYLLFVLGKDEEQQGWFYVSDPAPLAAETVWSFVGHVGMPAWYQNATLLTECDSGNLYLLATDNAGFDGGSDSGTEYAELMQITGNIPSQQVDNWLIASRTFGAGGGGYCTFRAAANPFVDRDGQIALYCHAYKANTDVLGRADSKLKLVEYAP
jgi:hypothetical protein